MSAPVTASPVVIRKRSAAERGAVRAGRPCAPGCRLRPDDRAQQVRGADEDVHVVVGGTAASSRSTPSSRGSSSTIAPPLSSVSNENRSPAANDSGRTTPSRSPGPVPRATASCSAFGDLLPVRQDDALRHAGRAGGEDDREGVRPPGRRPRCPLAGAAPAAAARPAGSPASPAVRRVRAPGRRARRRRRRRGRHARCRPRSRRRRRAGRRARGGLRAGGRRAPPRCAPARTSARIATTASVVWPAITPTGFDAPPGDCADARAAVVVGSERRRRGSASERDAPSACGSV